MGFNSNFIYCKFYTILVKKSIQTCHYNMIHLKYNRSLCYLFIILCSLFIFYFFLLIPVDNVDKFVNNYYISICCSQKIHISSHFVYFICDIFSAYRLCKQNNCVFILLLLVSSKKLHVFCHTCSSPVKLFLLLFEVFLHL